ncbi:MAG TPA: Fe-S protein assembly co-chaperone HscB [Vicinamibacterales bacterium]|nr:Fe-S protein assembly co-chaperone HscB [Vicinamibacterales bacterium]
MERSDFFSFLDLPRKLNIDMARLDERYRTLSRQFHPDFFYNATPAERRLSLERSSYLNDAYRALKDPIKRVEYLLKLEGLAPKNEQEASRQVPPALLEEVFALNEELDEIREQRTSGAPAGSWEPRLERARLPIEQKRARHEAELKALASEWDALVDDGDDAARQRVLEELRDRFLERNYINNLLAGIEREMNNA